jgi:hypothetical protein
MKNIALLLQIGELFNGRFTWRGLFHLFLFVLMGAIIVGFAVFAGYQAFRSRKKDDV